MDSVKPLPTKTQNCVGCDYEFKCWYSEGDDVKSISTIIGCDKRNVSIYPDKCKDCPNKFTCWDSDGTLREISSVKIYCSIRDSIMNSSTITMPADKVKTLTNAPQDMVNHPPHYEGNIECIDAMLDSQGAEAVKDFCICNAFKYIWRHRKKNKVEDIKKAKWYIDKYLELVEKGE